MERTLRGIAGLVILLSLTLHWFLDGADLERPSWLWLTAFVGFNLLQSAVTNWCPMMWFLQKLGMRRPAHAWGGKNLPGGLFPVRRSQDRSDFSSLRT